MKQNIRTRSNHRYTASAMTLEEKHMFDVSKVTGEAANALNQWAIFTDRNGDRSYFTNPDGWPEVSEAEVLKAGYRLGQKAPLTPAAFDSMSVVNILGMSFTNDGLWAMGKTFSHFWESMEGTISDEALCYILCDSYNRCRKEKYMTA